MIQHNDRSGDRVDDTLSNRLDIRLLDQHGRHPPEATDPLAQAILAALERKPPVEIPGDFATRVLARLPARLPAQHPRLRSVPPLHAAHYGRAALAAALLLLLASMLLVAPGTRGGLSTAALAVQAVLFTQFAALTMWLGYFRRA